MKIYHTETQEDYDALMAELKLEGCTWGNREIPIKGIRWEIRRDVTCVHVSDAKIMTVAKKSFFAYHSPDIPITKYKVKADEKMKFTKENVYKLFTQYRKDGISLNYLQDEIIKLDDTPEKVVVPKFVADWIEDCKSRGLGLSDLLNYWTSSVIPKEVIDFIEYDFTKIGCGHKEQELLAKAWLDGYEVEKEPLYYIPLPYLETSDGIQQVLSKRKGDKNYFACRPNEKLKQRFTKEELKRVPVSYKPYAKPIEEEEK